MKLYDSVGPNPKVVRMFLAERGVEIPSQTLDLMGGENRQDAHLARNPSGQSPTLELDDGSVLAELTAICEDVDEHAGASDLIGLTPETRAETRMWVRRIDLQILEPLTNGFRFSEGLRLFENRVHCIPAAADDLKAPAQERITWLDGQLGDSQWVCGDRFTLADIMLFAFLEFGESVGQPLNRDNARISAWYDRVAERPSAKA